MSATLSCLNFREHAEETMKDLYAGPLARSQQNTGDAVGAAIASDPGKAVAAMPPALIQLLSYADHPVVVIVVVALGIIGVISRECRRWYLTTRITDQDQAVRALELDARRWWRRQTPEGERKPGAGPPESPP